MMNRLIILLLTVHFLSSGYAIAEDTSSIPVSVLVEQAKKALAQNDIEERDRIVDKIFKLTTGLELPFERVPETLSADEIEKRICTYKKVTAQLYTPEELELLRHETRFRSYIVLFIKRDTGIQIRGRSEFESMQIRMECIQDNGEPVPEARALRDGQAWAMRLNESSIADAQTIAQEYEALLKHRPDEERYRWFHMMTGLIVNAKRSKHNLEESIQRVKLSSYRAELAEKADDGDVTVQLELARRLETGDKFEQNKLYAYYWYKRAHLNGGGKEAQEGLDRLLPGFDEIDLIRIEVLLDDKYRPY